MTQKALIIIPAYNEGKVLGPVIKNIKAELKSAKGIKFDLVVVNDGSSDNTKAVAEKNTTTISHLVNMGSGAATRTGLEYAKRNNYDFALTIDADGQHLPKDLVNVIKKLTEEEFDLVIGSRLIDPKGMPAHRVLGNKLLNAFTRILLGVRVTDSQSGLKGFSRKAIEKINIRTNGFEFCSEIVWRAKQQNLNIIEVPISAVYTDYSRQKGQSNVNALRIIKTLIIQKAKEV